MRPVTGSLGVKNDLTAFWIERLKGRHRLPAFNEPRLASWRGREFGPARRPGNGTLPREFAIDRVVRATKTAAPLSGILNAQATFERIYDDNRSMIYIVTKITMIIAETR